MSIEGADASEGREVLYAEQAWEQVDNVIDQLRLGRCLAGVVIAGCQKEVEEQFAWH